MPKCVVCGSLVKDSKTIKVVYKGKVLYFCCTSCYEKFKANPGFNLDTDSRH